MLMKKNEQLMLESKTPQHLKIFISSSLDAIETVAI